MFSLIEMLMIVGLATVTAAGASHGLTLLRQSRSGRTQHAAPRGQDEATGRPAAGSWHTPRLDHRYRMRYAVEYRIEDGLMAGTLLDMSKHGWRVMGEQPVSMGTVLSLRVCLPGQSRPLIIDQAIVRWTSDNEFGVELTSLSPDAAARFSDFLTAHLPTEPQRLECTISPFSYN